MMTLHDNHEKSLHRMTLIDMGMTEPGPVITAVARLQGISAQCTTNTVILKAPMIQEARADDSMTTGALQPTLIDAIEELVMFLHFIDVPL